MRKYKIYFLEDYGFYIVDKGHLDIHETYIQAVIEGKMTYIPWQQIMKIEEINV